MITLTFCTLLYIFVSSKVLSSSSDPSIQEVVQKINPILDRITVRLKELKLDIYKTLLKVTVEMHGSIFNSESSFLEVVEDLQSKSLEIVKIAVENNLDVDQCVAAQKSSLEKLLTVANTEANEHVENIKIRHNNVTEAANALIIEADNIEKNINKIIGYCIRQYNLAWQKERLLQCLFNETAELDSIVDRYYTRKNLIGEEIKNLNTTKKRNNLLSWLSSLDKEFLKCVITSSLTKNPKTSAEDLHSTDKGLFGQENNNIMPTQHKETLTADTSAPIIDGIKKLEKLLEQFDAAKNISDLKQINENNFTSNWISTFEKLTNEDDKNKTTDSSRRRQLLYISF